jgi:hypothetical protein
MIKEAITIGDIKIEITTEEVGITIMQDEITIMKEEIIMIGLIETDRNKIVIIGVTTIQQTEIVAMLGTMKIKEIEAVRQEIMGIKTGDKVSNIEI